MAQFLLLLHENLFSFEFLRSIFAKNVNSMYCLGVLWKQGPNKQLLLSKLIYYLGKVFDCLEVWYWSRDIIYWKGLISHSTQPSIWLYHPTYSYPSPALYHPSIWMGIHSVALLTFCQKTSSLLGKRIEPCYMAPEIFLYHLTVIYSLTSFV